VNDLAAAHVKALEYIRKTGKSMAVNLGTGNGTSVLEVIETARKVTGKPVPAKVTERRAGDPARLTASYNLALKELDWKAKFSDMKTIIETSWEIYRSLLCHPSLAEQPGERTGL
jgi:UDP-glucose 4-epimerase